MWKLNAGQKYCRMLHGSILQYFWLALSNYQSWKTVIWSSFEWPLKTDFTAYWIQKGQNMEFIIYWTPTKLKFIACVLYFDFACGQNKEK